MTIFNIFRKDRTTGQKGDGLLMAVNSNILTNVVGDLYTGNHEILTVEVKPTRSSPTCNILLC